ncbi:MAG: prolyl oligopeptidase family serine peptidase [Pseudomonadota bacterium]
MRVIASVVLLCLSAPGAAELTLETIMADPDWIGNSPEQAYWSDDSQAVLYETKRPGEAIRDQYRVTVADARVEMLEPSGPTTSNGSRQYNSDRTAVVWIEAGDVFWRRLPAGDVVQLTHTAGNESQAAFVWQENAVVYTTDDGFVRHDLESGGVAQLTDLKFEDDPDATETFDTLRENQRRIYTSVVEDHRREKAATQHDRAQRASRAVGAPTPIYLGKGVELIGSSLSPDARFLIAVTRPKTDASGQRGVMPNYVTESGYTETRKLRTRVGRNGPAPQTAHLIDLARSSASVIDLSTLPGMDEDPLAKLRKRALAWHTARGADEKAVEKQLEAPKQRPFGIEDIQWFADGSLAALQVHSHDNKDRWLVSVDPESTELTLLERLSDAAWINYAHNEFGWLSDQKSVWFLSERSGYSHLYTRSPDDRKARALTEGEFVVEEPVLSPDGEYLYFRANVSHPSTWEIYRVPVAGGEIERLTELGGVNHFRLSPDGQSLLVIHSEFDRHEELYAVVIGQSEARRLTHTISDEYAAIDWVIPEIVEVPSSHVDRPIYSKLYLPPDFDRSKQYPAVMFVHGAGYTQNAHAGWPYYFREFMFHTLLARRGVVVIDMDYRASRGYGRDWRTAIYQNMGHPELEDFQDGVQFLVDRYGVDPDRVGVYGGSYGGFMTFMALFRDPDLFAAGAALRPVVDWSHYNHGYTSNILNTPLIDPEAYERSSPIFFAEGLEAPLLIAAGMQDDNVFFQDSVLLVQRLLELQKEDFEIAIYPLDPHGFTHADSWLDEYRRILKLMERHVIAPER